MGSMWLSGNELRDSLIEVVGYKTGLLLTEEKLIAFLQETDAQIADKIASPMLRLHSSEYEGMFVQLLYAVGYVSSPRPSFVVSDVHHRFKRDEIKGPLVVPVGEIFIDHMAIITAENSNDVIEAFMRSAFDKHGVPGAEVALEYVRSVNRYQNTSPWDAVRRVDWNETRELKELFESEKLETMYGQFFDQRFIDYLAANFESDIDDVHWRQFEGVTAEHFARQGFKVDLGPGRNDGGIDLRVYPSSDNPTLPPLILVQCKRERRKIGKTIVKAVYADVLHERATSGLIVTTSELSPGADALRRARAYPVEAADRPKILEWLRAMRTKPL